MKNKRLPAGPGPEVEPDCKEQRLSWQGLMKKLILINSLIMVLATACSSTASQLPTMAPVTPQAVATAAPQEVATAAPSSSAGTTGTITLLDYSASLPANWEVREPSTDMRLAEYAIPGEQGEEGSEVIVFFFGPGQGGSVEDNIARWQSQFFDPDGNPVEPQVSGNDDGVFPITVAEFQGAYNRGVGMGGGPDAAKPDQILVAAIVETPQGNLFIQLFGPSASVLLQRETFLAFVRGIK